MNKIPVILRMAFRNLLEHKSKSLIVGILLAVGVLMLIVGNAFIEASKIGIRDTFTESYTGDVFISGTSPNGSVSLFGVMSAGGLDATPTIQNYEAVKAKVASMNGVASLTSLATGFGIAVKDATSGPMGMEDDATLRAPELMSSDSNAKTTQTTVSGDSQATTAKKEGEDERAAMGDRFLFLFGIDAHDYWQVFTSIEITEGSRLEVGQTGLILSASHMAKMARRLGRNLKIGDMLLIQGFSAGAMRLREVPIVGTYQQKGNGATPEQMSFVDIDTLRVLSGMTVGANENIEISETQTSMLALDDVDSLFGDDSEAGSIVESRSGKAAAFDDASLATILGDRTVREKLNEADSGAWQFMLARTKTPADTQRVITELNTWFAAEGLDLRAGDWQKASGPYGQSVDVVRIVFTIAIVILAIVAIIIIMNTLVISVIERTGEIGTMRAIGANRGFVRRLFATETFVLSLVFGLAGVILGVIVVAILKALHIEAGNPFLEVLFGGKYLNPSITLGSIVGSLIGIIAVGYIAHLYPVSVALRIQPVRAMQTE